MNSRDIKKNQRIYLGDPTYKEKEFLEEKTDIN